MVSTSKWGGFLVVAALSGLVGCGPLDETAPDAAGQGEQLAAPAKGGEVKAQATGWHRVCWAEAGLYYQINACPGAKQKTFSQNHKVYVHYLAGCNGVNYASITDNYNNAGLIRYDALCEGWGIAGEQPPTEMNTSSPCVTE